MWDKSNKKLDPKKIKVMPAHVDVTYSAAKETRNNVYRIVCLSVLGIVLIGTGIGLILTGKSKDIQDIIIIGAIFVCAGVLFLIMIFSAVTRPNRNRRNKVNSEAIKNMDNEADNVYFREQNMKIDEPEIVMKKHRPSEVDLYGYCAKEKLTIHLPEPEVVQDGKLPVVAFPNNVNPADVSNAPILTMTLRESTNLENS